MPRPHSEAGHMPAPDHALFIRKTFLPSTGRPHMPMPMTGNIDRVEVITAVQRRRRWSAEEKAQIVQETYAPGMSVSLVARQHGVAPNQVFKWRQLYAVIGPAILPESGL